MFRAIGRYIKAFFYMITGRIDRARKTLSANPYVVQATYDSVVEEKKKRIHQYKDAVAAMIAQEEKKLNKIKQLGEEVNRLEQLKEGAAAKAKSVVDQLKGQGASMEEIKQNDDYQKCLAAFNDFTSTLAEKQEHIAELENDAKELNANIGNHKVQLQQLQREIDKLKEEASATVADMITAKEEAEIADMISGISEDRYARELEDMRELRREQKAKARVAREMAGTDTKVLENEFMEYARTGVSTDEFDQLIGLAGEADTAAAAPQEQVKSQLPEQ